MKILMLAGSHDIHCVRWANQLCLNGHEVHVCFVSNHVSKHDKFEDGVYLHRLKFPAPIGYYFNTIQLRKIIKKIKPDILHSHYSSGYGTLGRMAKFNPYLISVYGSDIYDFPYKSFINMLIIKRNLKSADQIASTSVAMAKQTKKILDSSHNEILITPFGVDTNKFNKFSYSKNDDYIHIGSIKKLAPKYGIEYGIRAIDYLIKNENKYGEIVKKIKYYIYGEGPQSDELSNLVKELELCEYITFKGRIPNEEVPAVLNSFDIFLGTSILDSESFGVAIVEAMACEVPVIVTDVDGFKEVVDQGKSGVLVKRKDFIGMANEIYRLITNKELCNQIGHLQRERVKSEFDWFENVKTMEKIYMNLKNK